MSPVHFLEVAEHLELAGLVWHPEIGDEVSVRHKPEMVSILVDPHGMGPLELRSVYIWLPTVEQMVMQFEGRQAILYHAGLELSQAAMQYRTVVHSSKGEIASVGESLRVSMGLALRDLLLVDKQTAIN